jgi:hypothetical protein
VDNVEWKHVQTFRLTHSPDTLRNQILHTSLHMSCQVSLISVRDASTFSSLIVKYTK